jgi:hypothetical protein
LLDGRLKAAGAGGGPEGVEPRGAGDGDALRGVGRSASPLWGDVDGDGAGAVERGWETRGGAGAAGVPSRGVAGVPPGGAGFGAALGGVDFGAGLGGVD